MKGRKPKPTTLRKLHGRTSHASRTNKHEPTPAGALHEPPDWFTPEQRAAWAYALQNAPLGLLRRLDRGILTVWIIAEDVHRRAAIMLQESGLLVDRAEGGQKAAPAIGILHKQAMIMLKAASELGFSPAARVRVFADHPAGRDSEEHDDGSKISLAEYIRRAPPRPRMN